MKQIAVLSGKGGTGKTTITASLAMLMENGLFADCDVDAPDLHLLLHPKILKEERFTGLKIATIDTERCEKCMECRDNCRYGAITDEPQVDPLRCEGCAVCGVVCPVEAVVLKDRDSGRLYVSRTRVGTMVHARLNIAEEASGKLVSKVREIAKGLAEEEGRDFVLIDGPPGVGCPVIATLGGVDLALIITEPTVSGQHDLERIVGTARFFKVPIGVVINKSDLNEEKSKMIEGYCKEEGIGVYGRIPYDDTITKAMVEGKTIVEHSDGKATQALREIWSEITAFLSRTGSEG